MVQNYRIDEHQRVMQRCAAPSPLLVAVNSGIFAPQ